VIPSVARFVVFSVIYQMPQLPARDSSAVRQPAQPLTTWFGRHPCGNKNWSRCRLRPCTNRRYGALLKLIREFTETNERRSLTFSTGAAFGP
jgi:hypothetical protein